MWVNNVEFIEYKPALQADPSCDQMMSSGAKSKCLWMIPTVKIGCDKPSWWATVDLSAAIKICPSTHFDMKFPYNQLYRLNKTDVNITQPQLCGSCNVSSLKTRTNFAWPCKIFCSKMDIEAKLWALHTKRWKWVLLSCKISMWFAQGL